MGDGWQHKDDYPEPPDWGDEEDRYRGGGKAARHYHYPGQPSRRNSVPLEELAAAGLWRSQGSLIKIADMEDFHLRNSRRWAERQGMAQVCAILDKEIERRESPVQETQGASKMNTQEIITVMQLEAVAKLVKVRFENNTSEYTYKSTLGGHLQKDDLVVVQTGSNGFSLARVSDPNVSPSALSCRFDQLKHIVAVVDLKSFERTQQREVEAANKLAMAEVSNRLAKYRETLGAGALQNARQALGYMPPQRPVWGGGAQNEDGEIRTEPKVGEHEPRSVQIDERGHWIVRETGEDLGPIHPNLKAKMDAARRVDEADLAADPVSGD